MSIADILSQVAGKVEPGSLDSTVKFDCGEDGVLVIGPDGVSTDDAEADCTVSVALDDLKEIVSGDLDPTTAFMTGKLKVDGDMSVAMKLGQIL